MTLCFCSLNTKILVTKTLLGSCTVLKRQLLLVIAVPYTSAVMIRFFLLGANSTEDVTKDKSVVGLSIPRLLQASFRNGINFLRGHQEGSSLQ
jgi:hypothetical protein